MNANVVIAVLVTLAVLLGLSRWRLWDALEALKKERENWHAAKQLVENRANLWEQRALEWKATAKQATDALLAARGLTRDEYRKLSSSVATGVEVGLKQITDRLAELTATRVMANGITVQEMSVPEPVMTVAGDDETKDPPSVREADAAFVEARRAARLAKKSPAAKGVAEDARTPVSVSDKTVRPRITEAL